MSSPQCCYKEYVFDFPEGDIGEFVESIVEISSNKVNCILLRATSTHHKCKCGWGLLAQPVDPKMYIGDFYGILGLPVFVSDRVPEDKIVFQVFK